MIEAMKQALEALERYAPQHGHPDDMSDAITSLRTAIERTEKQEPAAWGMKSLGGDFIIDCITPEEHESYEGAYTIPLYTTPPAAARTAQRQPLTDEKIDDIWNRHCDEMGEASINDAYDIARAIEAAHGITGEKKGAIMKYVINIMAVVLFGWTALIVGYIWWVIVSGTLYTAPPAAPVQEPVKPYAYEYGREEAAHGITGEKK